MQSRIYPLLVLCQERKKLNIQKHNFACGYVWTWNLDSGIKAGARTEGV